ncbi:PASTA domain-containing protein [uncultured Vagococcus sp.]|uniref:PASTA domain-containing protein n=1 Tax=uncultured Vagococcus sp. TaxID=189676 RepID=UPI0028D1B604|nr:PASTA domain-containing protein [uncultured Vagococcus sp.]
MSNFLTNFQSGDYEKNKEKEVPEKPDRSKENGGVAIEQKLADTELGDSSQEEATKMVRRHSQEETEHDPTYQKRQRKKWLLIGLLGTVAVVAISLTIYQLNHVEMPDFKGKAISDVRTWAAKNKVTVETKSDYSVEKEANQILKQPVPKGKKVRKGQELSFLISKGADPEEPLNLPDFSTLSSAAAEDWLKQNKVENLKLILEYSEQIETGKLLRTEIKEELKKSFKRKDSGTLYYSKGKEVYQKDIVVPDFSSKLKSEVETWAKSNSIQMTYKDVASKEQELGKVLKQSIAPKEKIAKETKMEVEVSAGKPIVVPDFETLTPEEALAQKGVEVTVKHQYSNEVPYGQLIWQTLPSGAELTEKDDSAIVVTYSEGKPYLKDVVGETEGALQKIFFDEYQAKGANINYTIKYVNSEEKKGTVVSMSAVNLYVPMDYTVEIRISTGNP